MLSSTPVSAGVRDGGNCDGIILFADRDGYLSGLEAYAAVDGPVERFPAVELIVPCPEDAGHDPEGPTGT